VALLAYSPLAMGHLTAKYLADGGPAEARLNRYKGRYAEAESRYSFSRCGPTQTTCCVPATPSVTRRSMHMGRLRRCLASERHRPNLMEAVAQYAAVAADANITPTALALRCALPSCALLRLRARAWFLPPPLPVVSVATRVLHHPSPPRDTGIPLRAALRARA
jgi:hypothetical protein